MTERLHRTKRAAHLNRLNQGLGLIACAAGLFGATQACGSNGSDNGAHAGSGNLAGSNNGTGGGSAGSSVGNAGSPIGNAGSPGVAGSGSAGAPVTGGGAPGTAGGSSTAGSAGTPPAGGSGGTPPVNQTDNVLQRNNNASRDGLFVQAKFTKAAVPMMAADATFNTGAKFTGNVWASPLYLAPAAAGGKGLFFIVTTGNDVIAIDETSGATVWTKSIGTPAQANGVNCGNIHPLGILSTPVIDEKTRTIYVAGAVGDTSTIQKHVIMAYNADDGSAKAGWPVDTTGMMSGSVSFTAPPQNQRSALSLVNGKVYVGYGGHIGDCGPYHGWIIAVDAADPTKKAGWATLGQGEAIWAAGGFASDGTNLFPVTGNHTGNSGGDSRSTSDSEAVVRLSGMAEVTRNDMNMYFPTSWKTMDSSDADLGGSNSVLLQVGSTNYVAAVAKDGNMYLLNPTNLGGQGGHVMTFKVSSGGAMAVKTSPTAFKTAKGTHYVFSTDSGAVCPGGAGGKSIVSVLLTAGSDGKPTAKSEWCSALTGAVTAPISTTTDGTANPLVWYVDSGKLTAVDGEDGTKVFASTDTCAGVRQWTSPIATKGRVVVGGDKNLCSWSVK
ncbi:MAG TPA: hypothetical protein VFK05_24875 [Polyangiaceae bacterium]|nr:hypothetical protein [Polyangiaceae bacterium]